MKKRNTPEQDTCSNSGSLCAEAKFQSCTLLYIANRIFTTPVYKFFLHIILVENKFSEDTNHKCLISIRLFFCRVYDDIFFLLQWKLWNICFNFWLTGYISILKKICSKRILISARLGILWVFNLKKSSRREERDFVYRLSSLIVWPEESITCLCASAYYPHCLCLCEHQSQRLSLSSTSMWCTCLCLCLQSQYVFLSLCTVAMQVFVFVFNHNTCLCLCLCLCVQPSCLSLSLCTMRLPLLLRILFPMLSSNFPLPTLKDEKLTNHQRKKTLNHVNPIW